MHLPLFWKKKVLRDIKRAILFFFVAYFPPSSLNTEIFLLVQINPAVTFIHRTNPTEMLSQKVCFMIVQSLYVKGMMNRSEETNGLPGTKRAGGCGGTVEVLHTRGAPVHLSRRSLEGGATRRAPRRRDGPPKRLRGVSPHTDMLPSSLQDKHLENFWQTLSEHRTSSSTCLLYPSILQYDSFLQLFK